jgi:hypothetical protein
LDKGAYKLTNFSQTPNPNVPSTAVRLRGISFVVARETTQIVS